MMIAYAESFPRVEVTEDWQTDIVWYLHKRNMYSYCDTIEHYKDQCPIDEFWTFVGNKKNKQWLIYAYHRETGEIGAGHSVTVMYEIVPTSDEDEVNGNLKYQSSTLTDEAINSNEWITLSVRYKEPDEDESKLLEYPIGGENYNENTSDDFKFASAVAEFAMILRDSEYIADGSLKQIMDELKDMNLEDEYREEFEELVLMTKLRNQ